MISALLSAAVLLGALQGPALASDVVGPLDWKKIRFEEKLQEKLSVALGMSIPEKRYVASVSAELKPKKNPGTAPTAPESDSLPALGKLEVDPYSMAYEDTENDLFQNLKQVNVMILLDNSVDDGKKAIAEKIARGIVGSVGENPVDIKIEKVDLLPPVTPEPEWGLKKWLQEFKLPLGLIGSVIIFGGFALLLVYAIFRGYKKLENRRILLLEKKEERENAEAKRVEEKHEAEETQKRQNPLYALKLLDGVERGFSRLRLLIKTAPDKIAGLVKMWLVSGEPGANEALTVIPQILTMEELTPVFELLSIDDRKEWKKKLTSEMTESVVMAAESFISRQIIDNLLAPASGPSADVAKLISNLKLTECVQLASTDPTAGAMLFHLLSTSQVAKMVALMPADAIMKMTMESLKINDAQIKDKLESLRTVVGEIRAQQADEKRAIFLERAEEVLREAGPAKEGSIFGALAEAQEYALLEATARKFLPSDIVFRLPPTLLRESLGMLGVAERADMIICLEPDVQKRMLDASGEPGSKLRELMDVEIEGFHSDEIRLKRAQKNKDVAIARFVEMVRDMIRNSDTAQAQVEDVLNAWIREKTNGQFGGASGVAA